MRKEEKQSVGWGLPAPAAGGLLGLDIDRRDPSGARAGCDAPPLGGPSCWALIARSVQLDESELCWPDPGGATDCTRMEYAIR
jgi:hypothetical protein